MNEFDLKIRYPHQTGRNDADHLGAFDIETILKKFDEVAWRQQLVRQLQLDGASTSFIVTDERSGYTIRIILDAFAKTQHLEFKLESNIPVLIAKKDVFGLLTRKTKDSISFKHLTQSRAKEYLLAFMNGEIAELEALYRENLSKLMKSAS